jgi:hypothetical protein
LLPYREDTMELVSARDGKIPYGRRPVEGGYEEGGEKLYHALAVVNGVKVPGKTGEHLVRIPLIFSSLRAKAHEHTNLTVGRKRLLGRSRALSSRIRDTVSHTVSGSCMRGQTDHSTPRSCWRY